MDKKNTKFDNIITQIKNTPVITSILVAGVIIISIATFSEALQTLINLPSDKSPISARKELTQLALDYTPDTFILSAKKGDVLAVQLFLRAEMSPDVSNKDGNTALMYAAKYNRSQVIDALIKANTNVNITDKRGNSVFSWTENETTIKRLLENDATIETKNSALVYAAKRGNLHLIKILIDKGASIKNSGARALLSATSSHYIKQVDEQKLIDTVNFLLDSGINVNSEDSTGWTGLLWATYFERILIAKLLINRGADINSKCSCKQHNAGGYTPLMLAVNKNNYDLVSLLLTNGAHVNEKNNDGKTPLMLAAWQSQLNKNIVPALLNAGSRLNEQDNNKQTAMSIAKSRENIETFEVLKEFKQGNKK